MLRRLTISGQLLMALWLVCQPAEARASTPNLPGVELKDLDDTEKQTLVSLLEEQFDPCGKPRSFLAAVQDASTCPVATKLANFVVGQIQRGLSKRQVVRSLLDELKRLTVKHTFVLTGRPSVGPDAAKVTIVEFSDFQCPHCKIAASKVPDLARKKGVRLVMKQYPLDFHPAAKEAAVVCVAASMQGKFWPLHDKLFADQDRLDDKLVEKIAKDVGVDWNRALSDRKKAEALVAEDKREGDLAGVDGTPTFFLNGLRVEYEELEPQIDAALKGN